MAIVFLTLLYWVQRSSVTVGDYSFRKHVIHSAESDDKLRAIREQEEEQVKNLTVKLSTVKVTTTTEKTVQPNEEARSSARGHLLEHAYSQPPSPESNQTTRTMFWVYSDGALTFKNRIKNYVNKIEEVRSELVSARTGSNWTDLDKNIEVLWCNQDDFLKTIVQKHHLVKTVALSWHPWKINTQMKWTSLGDVSNLLIQKYNEWSGSERLCQMIRSPGYTKARWDAVYRQQCMTDIGSTRKSKSLEFVYFWGKPINKDHYWPNDGFRYPDYFYDSVPKYIFYVHFVQDAVITALGDVISGGLKLVPYSCSQDLDKRPPPNYKATSLYEEVFIMGQYWGDTFFHKMLENFPRIAPYLGFLRRHSKIKIHVAETGGYTAFMMEFLGIDPARLVKGVIRSKLVIMSQATPCGFAHVQGTQLLSDKLLSEISKRFPDLSRTNVVLIQRSGSRRFTKAREIQEGLESAARKHNFTFQLFPDNPTPAPVEAMKMFNQAVLVVGPHGAGLSNLLYCRPGTFVIEGVCNPPHVNMCFQRTAHILGHHYHGIVSSSGCEDVVNVEPADILSAADTYLRMASEKRN